MGGTHVKGWVNTSKLNSAGSFVSIHPEKPSSGSYKEMSIPVDQIANTTKKIW